MAESDLAKQYRAKPQPALTFHEGPWLKPQSATQTTKLEAKLLGSNRIGSSRSRLAVLIHNVGDKPAFMTSLNVSGAKRSFYATDNFFWLAAGEHREVSVDVLWRDESPSFAGLLCITAWNARPVALSLTQP
jgi:beta-mannosidase